MNGYRALGLFGLTETATIAELNAVFRRMAKKYHPDTGGCNETVSHERMTRLNLAYEEALTFLTAPGSYTAHRSASARAGSHERPVKKPGDLDDGARAALFSAVRDYLGLFRRAVSTVQQAVYLYYQYGLDNVHLREEGVRRFRYRDSMNRMREALRQMEALAEPLGALADPLAAAGKEEAVREERERLDYFTDYTGTLLRSMSIDRKLSSDAHAEERTAYGHYHRGSGILDREIRDRFCGRDAGGRPPAAGDLSIGYHEFMQVITRYYRSSWLPETVIRMHLLELCERGREMLPAILI